MGPPSRAVAQPDGSYRIWGHTTFISGCHNATWCFMVAPVFDGDEVRLTDGVPTVKLWMLHRDEWEILDTWDVAGLRGSGSHDVVTEGGLVPERFADVDLVTVPPLYENPVYRIPVPLRLAYNKAAVAIGVARGALDEFAVLANAKTPMLIQHGTADANIPTEQSVDFAAALSEVLGAENVTLQLLEGAAHAGPEFTTTENVAVVLDWLDSHLK